MAGRSYGGSPRQHGQGAPAHRRASRHHGPRHGGRRRGRARVAEDRLPLAVVLELEEGDALYLPPFYTHHVEALTNLSVSVAVWSESDECRRKDALESLPLPWEGDWPAGKIVRAASLFLRGVLTHAYDGDEEAGRRTLRALLESRYEPLRSLPEADREGLLSTEAEAAVLRGLAEALRWLLAVFHPDVLEIHYF